MFLILAIVFIISAAVAVVLPFFWAGISAWVVAPTYGIFVVLLLVGASIYGKPEVIETD